jgi:hypothetical protein
MILKFTPGFALKWQFLENKSQDIFFESNTLTCRHLSCKKYLENYNIEPGSLSFDRKSNPSTAKPHNASYSPCVFFNENCFSSVNTEIREIDSEYGGYRTRSRGRCYDHNFLQFLPIFGKKIGIFLKNQCYEQKFAYFSFVLSQKRQFFFAIFFGENILKIITSVPG